MKENLLLASLSDNAKNLAAYLRLVKPTEDQKITTIPFTLFPTPIPKQGFDLINSIQPHINKLVYLASRDIQFLYTSLKSCIENDVFVRNLFKIYEDLQTCDTKSEYEVGFLRSDYMFGKQTISDEKFQLHPLQVEINTFAPSYSGFGKPLKTLYSRVLKEAKMEEKGRFLPSNNSTDGAARGLLAGWEAYGNPAAVILFFVIENDSHLFEQRAIEYEIYKINEDTPIRRKTFDDLIKHSLVSEDGTLLVDDEEVAVVYFRNAYDKEQFPTEQHWATRRSIERSRAIKCPSVGGQLIECKKMQEVFAQPGAVERFIEDTHIAEKIRSTFTGFHSLEMNQEGDARVEMALSDPERYVLKPQREGGAYNLTGDKMVSVLGEIGSDKRRTVYTLMDKIRPQATENYIVDTDGSLNKAEVIPELGVYGMFFAKDGQLIDNWASGHMLRTKSVEQEGEGVMARPSYFSCPLLV